LQSKCIKQKITASAAIFVISGKERLSFGFGHGADAPGAQHLFDLAIALVDRHLLQVGFELTIGGTHGERPVMSKSCRLSAMGTLSHLTISFLAIIPEYRLAPASTAFYHTSYPSTRRVLIKMRVNNYLTEYTEKRGTQATKSPAPPLFFSESLRRAFACAHI
jgi:hypothetical protein